jgi:hypothetical protein
VEEKKKNCMQRQFLFFGKVGWGKKFKSQVERMFNL